VRDFQRFYELTSQTRLTQEKIISHSTNNNKIPQKIKEVKGELIRGYNQT